MRQLSRRAAIRVLAAGGGLLGAGLAVGRALRDLPGPARRPVPAAGHPAGPGTPGSMTGNVTQADMSRYMDLFSRHAQRHRTVQLIPGGVRASTEAGAPDLTAQLQAHVTSMYAHLDEGAEVSRMIPHVT